MTGSGRGLRFLLALLVPLSLPGLAAALEVTLSVPQDHVTVGEQFRVSIEVRHEGMGTLPEPELPAVENLRQVGRYKSQGFSYVNGRATSTVTIQYVMVADKEGTYTLGPVTVAKGKKRAVSETARVDVEPAGSAATVPRRFGDDAAASADAGNDLIVLGQVDNPSPYVNQQITYTFTFLRRVRLLEGTQYSPPETNGFWSEEIDTTEPTEVTLDGRRYVAERVRTALFPTGPGLYEIGRATLRATVEERRRSRVRDPFDIFGNDRFGLFRSGREVVLRTDPVVVDVKPLPAKGKPQNFSGAVGRFKLVAEVDRREVEAGDPITLTVALSGEGNVKVVPAPDVSILTDFKIYESRSEESSTPRGGKIHGKKVWEYVLVPTTGGDIEIPPVRLSAFDPARGEYVTLATEAIPLSVQATDLDEALARGDDLAVAKERVRLRQRDIRYVKGAPASFRRAGGSPFTRPGFLLAHVVPVLAFAGSSLLRRHRQKLRSDLRYARSRAAFRTATRRLDAARRSLEDGRLEAFHGELSAALRGYVADKLHLAAANLEEGPVRAGLEACGVEAARIDDLFAMLETCDSARFSPAGADPAAAVELLDRGKRWMTRVEKR